MPGKKCDICGLEADAEFVISSLKDDNMKIFKTGCKNRGLVSEFGDFKAPDLCLYCFSKLWIETIDLM